MHMYSNISCVIERLVYQMMVLFVSVCNLKTWRKKVFGWELLRCFVITAGSIQWRRFLLDYSSFLFIFGWQRYQGKRWSPCLERFCSAFRGWFANRKFEEISIEGKYVLLVDVYTKRGFEEQCLERTNTAVKVWSIRGASFLMVCWCFWDWCDKVLERGLLQETHRQRARGAELLCHVLNQGG